MIASLQIGNLTTRGAGGAKILADQPGAGGRLHLLDDKVRTFSETHKI